MRLPVGCRIRRDVFLGWRCTLMRYTMLRTGLLLVALLVGLVLLAPAPAADDKDEGFTNLFNGKDFSGWKTILGKEGDPAKTWSIKDGVIICTGRPNGYFYTDKSFKNYILRFDWRYAASSGNPDDTKFNSGCLIHITGPQKVWPQCVEVQGLN